MPVCEFPYTPFPFNITPASPIFDLSPVTSNISQGWVPSCTTPDCVPTTNWTTSSPGASLLLHYWGWGVVFEGSVKGNMSVELIRDGVKEAWNPSGNTLFTIPGGQSDESFLRNITLKVLDVSPGAELTVNQARINGSTYLTELVYPGVRWTIPSNDPRLNYTGFVQQASVAQAGSPTTYTSLNPGDTASMQFNASTFLIHGPCGPTTGLMKVTIDGTQSTVNTSKPIASDDCVLFQALGLRYYPDDLTHELLIEHAGGGSLGIDRLEFFWLNVQRQKNFERVDGGNAKKVGAVIGIVIGVLWIIVGWWFCLRKTKRGKRLSLSISNALSR